MKDIIRLHRLFWTNYEKRLDVIKKNNEIVSGGELP